MHAPRRRASMQKPNSPARVRWANPITKGLVGAWPMNEGRGDMVYDATGLNHGVMENNSPARITWKNDAWGRGLHFDGTNASAARVLLGSINASNPLSLANKAAATWMWMCTTDSNLYTGSIYPRIIDKSSSSSGTNGWCVWYKSARSIHMQRVGANHTSSALTPSGGGWNARHAIVRDPTKHHATSWQNVHFYVEGKYAQTVGSNTTNFSSTTTNACIGNWNHTTDRIFAGTIYYVYVWDRALSDWEVASVTADPYQFIDDGAIVRPYVYFPAGGATPSIPNPIKMMV